MLDTARQAVITEARKWIGTPYHSCADVRGAGVDCLMLLVRVFVDTGLCEPFDPRPYTEDWHLHRSEETYLDGLFRYCKEVRAPRPGDIMMFRWGRTYSHGALVSCLEPFSIIHAYQPARQVIEERLENNQKLTEAMRKPRIFSYVGSTA